jgi:hypothetical protein
MIYNEKKGKEYIFNTGRGIKFRAKHNHEMMQGRIIAVKDSFMVINCHPEIDTISLSDIYSVKKATVFHSIMRGVSAFEMTGPALIIGGMIFGHLEPYAITLYALVLPPSILLISIPWLIPRRGLKISDDKWKLKAMVPNHKT